MPASVDLLYVALFAVALPLWDYLVYWPAFQRRALVDPAGARLRLWKLAIASAWPLVAVGAALWSANGRSWVSFGFALPAGWRLWSSIAVVLLLALYQGLAVASLVSSAESRATLRQKIGTLTAFVPQTGTEVGWFAGLSLTAGFCEEFLYRGYFIAVLVPWLGWWGAAVFSLPFFAIGHLYQGWKGVLNTGIAGALYTLVVAIFGSLWPAIALHALIDLGSGVMAWLALRGEVGGGAVVQAEK
jgi:uncharacterized protein